MIAAIEEFLIGFWENFPFIVAFIGGLLAFFSPCTLPLVPAYMSYITGISINEIKEENKKKKLLFNTIFFVVGFSVVFIIVFLILLYFANFANKYIYNGLISKLLGIIVIGFGLNLIGILKWNFMYKEKRLNLDISSGNYFASFLIGLIFGFGWQPCIGPILAMVVGLAANQGSLLKGIVLLMLFSFGLGIPFIMFGLLIEKSMNFVNNVKKHMKKIEIISGTVLIIAGIYIFF